MNHQENSNNVLIGLYMNQNHQSFRHPSLFSPDLITMIVLLSSGNTCSSPPADITITQTTNRTDRLRVTSHRMFYFENLTPTTALNSPFTMEALNTFLKSPRKSHKLQSRRTRCSTSRSQLSLTTCRVYPEHQEKHQAFIESQLCHTIITWCTAAQNDFSHKFLLWKKHL